MKQLSRIIVFVFASVLVAISFNNCGQPFKTIDLGSQSGSESLEISNIDAVSLDNVVAAKKSCDIQFQESDLVTHYKSGAGFQIGANDISPVKRSASLIAEDLRAQRSAPLYDPSLYIASSQYFDVHFDLIDIRPQFADLKKKLNMGCSDLNENGVSFKAANTFVDSQAKLQGLIQENKPYYQWIHSVPGVGGQYSILIPPQFSKQKSYPLLLTGHYSVNEFVSRFSEVLMKMSRYLYEKNNTGSVILIWNKGGTLVSRSLNPRPFAELNLFLKWFVPALSIDRNKVVTLGGSRGGATALQVAGSSEITEVNVAFAYANVPPTEAQIFAEAANPTYPQAMSLHDESTGLAGAWAESSRNSLMVKAMQNLTGQNSMADIKVKADLTSNSFIENLRQRKTQIILDLTSSDTFVPFVGQRKLQSRLLQSNLPVQSLIVYRGAHGFHGNAFGITTDKLEVLGRSGRGVVPSLINPGRIDRYLFEMVNGAKGMKVLDRTTEPLNIEFPIVYENTMGITIAATGAPGSQYILKYSIQGVSLQSSFELDSDGITQFKLPLSISQIGNSVTINEVQQNKNGVISRIIFDVNLGSRLKIDYRPDFFTQERWHETPALISNEALQQGWPLGVAGVQVSEEVISTTLPTPSPTSTPSTTPTATPTMIPTPNPTATPSPTATVSQECQFELLTQGPFSPGADITIKWNAPGAIEVGQRNQIINTQGQATPSSPTVVSWGGPSEAKTFTAAVTAVDFTTLLLNQKNLSIRYELMKKSSSGQWTSCNRSIQIALQQPAEGKGCEVPASYETTCGPAGASVFHTAHCRVTKSPIAEEVQKVFRCQNNGWQLAF